jgi:hypothetical protein
VNDELRTVAGLGVERRWYFSKNFSLHFELAKSTTKQNTSGKQDAPFKDLFTTFSSRTIGFYGEARAYLPKTNTDAEFLYKYWGTQFESFNASQYFNPQNNLAAKLTQPVFKRKLYLSGGIRYTDFSSPGITSNIKTKTFFASGNATLRLKKFPIVNVGYYPGSQLYWLDQRKLYEYFYYILNATASHHFAVNKVPMQVVISYNKFFNKYSDSLVSGSQSYYNLFWTAWKNNFGYTVNLSHQQVENRILSTIESGISYTKTKFRIGGSMKWNHIESAIRMGYSLNLGWSIGRIGTINLLYDKSFLPERTGIFIPVETGQIQIIKPLKFRIWQ